MHKNVGMKQHGESEREKKKIRIRFDSFQAIYKHFWFHTLYSSTMSVAV